MAATISFSKTRVQKVLRAFERRSYYWGETPLAIIEREFGDNAGAFLWHVWREQAYDPTADAALFECMAAAQGCYDARESIALLQRLPKASDSLPRLPPGNATVLHGWCDPLDQMMVHAAHLAPDALRAAWTQLRGGPARDGVALALARAGAITASELPPGATERLAAHGLLCAGQPAYERARAACFASDESFWQALLAAAETATVMSTATLEHLASTAPPRVWVHVAYHVGAAEYADAETATPHVTRLFDAATDDTRAEMRACVDRMLGAADEVSPWRLDVFALGLALAAASAEEPLDPRHDPLLVAALRVETRWPGDCARLRAVLAALPAPRAEAVLVSAAGVLPGGAVRRRQLGARILKSFSAVPTPAVLTAVLDAMDTWDADETHDKLDVAMEGFLLVGTAALPHLDAAESRHRAAAPLYRRIARRIEAVG